MDPCFFRIWGHRRLWPQNGKKQGSVPIGKIMVRIVYMGKNEQKCAVRTTFLTGPYPLFLSCKPALSFHVLAWGWWKGTSLITVLVLIEVAELLSYILVSLAFFLILGTVILKSLTLEVQNKRIWKLRWPIKNKCSHLKCLNKLISLKCPQVSQQQQKHFAKLSLKNWIFIYIYIYLFIGGFMAKFWRPFWTFTCL